MAMEEKVLLSLKYTKMNFMEQNETKININNNNNKTNNKNLTSQFRRKSAKLSLNKKSLMKS